MGHSNGAEGGQYAEGYPTSDVIPGELLVAGLPLRLGRGIGGRSSSRGGSSRSGGVLGRGRLGEDGTAEEGEAGGDDAAAALNERRAGHGLLGRAEGAGTGQAGRGRLAGRKRHRGREGGGHREDGRGRDDESLGVHAGCRSLCGGDGLKSQNQTEPETVFLENGFPTRGFHDVD